MARATFSSSNLHNYKNVNFFNVLNSQWTPQNKDPAAWLIDKVINL